MSSARDPERTRTYNWEEGVLIGMAPGLDEPPPVIRLRGPLPPPLVELHQAAWTWGAERFGPVYRDLPRLKFSSRMRLLRGNAGPRFERGKITARQTITLSCTGLCKRVLLHEIAHTLVPVHHQHGALFRRAVLDLYAKFLGAHECYGMLLARELGIPVADPQEVRSANQARREAASPLERIVWGVS